MKRRFWRAIAKFACKRAGLTAIERIHGGGPLIRGASQPTTTVRGANVTVKWN